MPASYQEILASRIFKFVIGEEIDGNSSEFFVHEDAIAQLSKPLHTLTKGELAEAQSGCATWKHVSKETFERFVQFAYTGDYSIPKTEKRTAITEREKSQLSAASSPKAPNGIHKHRNSVGSVDTATGDLNGNAVPAYTNGVRPEAVPEKTDDEGAPVPTPSSKKNKKKKKGKTTVVNLPVQDPDPEPEVQDSTKDVEPPPVEYEVPPVDSEPIVAESESTVPPEQDTATTAEPNPESGPADTKENQTEPAPQALTSDFKSLTYPLLAPRDNYTGTCDPSPDFHSDHSYSAVLLSHASLYVLGEFQLINSLKALSLHKLHKTLCTFQLNNENIGDVTDLARYAYSEEGKGFDEGIGELRGLVCHYLAIHAVKLSLDARFMNLLAEGGQIVKDFFRFQLQGMH